MRAAELEGVEGVTPIEDSKWESKEGVSIGEILFKTILGSVAPSHNMIVTNNYAFYQYVRSLLSAKVLYYLVHNGGMRLLVNHHEWSWINTMEEILPKALIPIRSMSPKVDKVDSKLRVIAPEWSPAE